MRKFTLCLLILLPALHSNGAITAGFEKSEARDMLAICNSFTFIDLYGSDAGILPEGYLKKYTSGTLGMDNAFQVYVHDDEAVINFRGSTEKQLSWIENFYASMIPASGTIKVNGEKFNYCFAKDQHAAVHSGYALALAFMHRELLDQIIRLNKDGIYSIILTGHSQGGALANMFRAYAENLPGQFISKKNRFRCYVFAAPMTGNKEFANEYNVRYAHNGTSFNVVNPADIIPDFPVSYNDTNFIRDNINKLLFGKESFSLKKFVVEGGVRMFDGSLSKLMNYMGNSANRKIDKEVAQVELPAAVDDINYFRLGEQVLLQEFPYPKILKDSSILQNDSLMQIYERDANGFFLDEKLYVKSPWTFQHKPYNYYVAFLKMYFPQEYQSLERKYLVENL